jgi:sialidase-1
VGEPLPAQDPGPAAEDGGGAAVCLADGRVLLHAWAAPRRWAAVSDDGGHSYGPLQPVDELSDPGSSGSLVRFDGLPAVGGLAAPASDRWLLAANCQDPLLRRNVVLSLSRDNGHSWPHKLTVYPSGASGPAAVRVPDGRIGVLYQRQGGREIVYATADPGRLLAAWPRGAVTARDDDDGAGPGPVTGPLPVPKDYPLRFDMVLHAVRSQAEGRPAPGYRAGDALVFAGRAKMLGPQHLRVRLSGGFDNAADFPPQDLGPGGEARYLHPVRTVTGADVAAGGLTVSFTCTAAPANQPSGGAPVASRTREFSIDVVSGEIRET